MKSKTLYVFIVLITFFMLIVLSCASSKKIDELKAELNDINGKINNAFLDVKKTALENKALIEKELSQDMSKVSVKGMMIEEGGVYSWFENYMIYPKKEPVAGCGSVSFYNIFSDPDNKPQAKFLPGTPGSIEILKKMKVIENILKDLKDINSKDAYKTAYWNFIGQAVLTAPTFYDIPSVIPPGIPSLNVFEYYSIGTPEQNPQKEQKWTNDAFVNVVGGGWIYTCTTPLYVNGNFEGIFTKDIYLFDVKEKLIKNSKNIILFVSPGMSIIGLSESGLEALGLNELGEYDYVEQLQTNPKVSEQYKLDYQDNPDEIKNIAVQIKNGETEFIQKNQR